VVIVTPVSEILRHLMMWTLLFAGKTNLKWDIILNVDKLALSNHRTCRDVGMKVCFAFRLSALVNTVCWQS
jgi:hypothetical protein